MKRFVSLVAAVLLITILFPVTALAHGHCGGRGGYGGGYGRTGYALCDVNSCHTTYSHRHDGTWYGGHSIEDGHDYHDYYGHGGGGWRR